jgi:hypothetical protein
MASRKSRRVNTKVRTKNWRAYEAGLKSRGDVTVWLSEEAITAWTPPNNGRRGGQLRYSNLAILTALTLRLLFHLPLRQTEGFVASLLRLMAVNLAAPDHTTLSRRNRNVDVPQPTSSHEGPFHLIVDSTGLKIFGAGEWNSRKHRKAKDRGDWRKLHLGVDDEGFIVAQALTESTGDDAAILPELLSHVSALVKRFTGDGAYDRRSTYEQIGEVGTDDVVIVVPPRRPATKSGAAEGPWAQRDRHVEMIDDVGRQAWQELVGYRQQARVEGTFLRYKRTLGCGLQARGLEAQTRESMIGCSILNRMLELGRSDSVAVTG